MSTSEEGRRWPRTISPLAIDTPDDVTALSVMKGLHKAMTDGLARDPLGWAEQAGVPVVLVGVGKTARSPCRSAIVRATRRTLP